MNILPKEEFMSYMDDSLQFIKDNINDEDPTKFTTVEYEKFRRVVDYMQTTHYDPKTVEQGRRDFYNWFNALDQRRDTNLLETFPEMTGFYNECELLNG